MTFPKFVLARFSLLLHNGERKADHDFLAKLFFHCISISFLAFNFFSDFSLRQKLLKRSRNVSAIFYASKTYPTEHLPILKPVYALIDVSKLLKIRRSTYFEALKLWNIRSGSPICPVSTSRLALYFIALCPAEKDSAELHLKILRSPKLM